MLHLVRIATAQNIQDPLGNRFTSVSNLIAVGLQLVFWIGAGLSVAFIALSGLKMMSSQGDPKAIQSAQQSLTWSIVGFIVVIMAGAAGTIISRMLGATNFTLLPSF